MKNTFLTVALLTCARWPGTLYAQTVSSSQEIKNVNATSDVAVNASLPAAPPTFRLSGAISGTVALLVAVTAQSTDGVSSSTGSVNQGASTYSMMVPAGTYKLSVSYVADFSGGVTISTFNDPVPVQVNSDTVRDIAVLPTVTHGVSGTISGLDSRFSSTFLVFALTDPNGTSSAASPSKLNADGTYAVKLSDGAYAVLLLSSTADTSRVTSLALGSVTVSGADVAADFTAPVIANLSGTVTTAGIPVPMGSTVIGIEGNPFLLRTTSSFPLFSFGSGAIDNTSGSYQVLLANGHTYTLGVDLKLLPETLPQSSGDFIFLLPNNTQLAGDTAQDIAVPQTPGTVTISGLVTDRTGAPVANVTVSATTAEVTGISMGAFSRDTQTDAGGSYRLVVLSGTNYDLIFSPPIDASSPFQLNRDLRDTMNSILRVVSSAQPEGVRVSTGSR